MSDFKESERFRKLCRQEEGYVVSYLRNSKINKSFDNPYIRVLVENEDCLLAKKLHRKDIASNLPVKIEVANKGLRKFYDYWEEDLKRFETKK